MTDPVCPFGEHKMVISLCQQLLDRLKEEGGEQKEQWGEIGKKIGSKVVMWGVGILFLLMISAVGFLWHNQSGNRNEIMTEVKAISAVIVGRNGNPGLSERFTKVEQQLNDHLAETKPKDGNGKKK